MGNHPSTAPVAQDVHTQQRPERGKTGKATGPQPETPNVKESLITSQVHADSPAKTAVGPGLVAQLGSGSPPETTEARNLNYCSASLIARCLPTLTPEHVAAVSVQRSRGLFASMGDLAGRCQLSKQQRESLQKAGFYVEPEQGPVNVNTCSGETLALCDGIDEKSAAKLLSERSVGGPFADYSDLVRRMAGKYFGDKKVAALKQRGFIIIAPPSVGAAASKPAPANAAGGTADAAASSDAGAVPSDAPSPQPGTYWWQRPDEQPGAPFPAQFNVHRGGKARWEYALDGLPPFDATAAAAWAFPPAEVAEKLRAQLEAAFPVVTSGDADGGNGRETKQFRTRATTHPEARGKVWARCSVEGIPRELSNKFRLDPYGNVVALAAQHGAVCAFDVDHVFPWSRGGRSVDANFAAVQWYANEGVKRDQILAAACAQPGFVEDMCCGLRLPQLLALASLRERCAKRTDKARFDHRLDCLLISVRYELPLASLSRVPPEHVFGFLEQHYNLSMSRLPFDVVAPSQAALVQEYILPTATIKKTKTEAAAAAEAHTGAEAPGMPPAQIKSLSEQHQAVILAVSAAGLH